MHLQEGIGGGGKASHGEKVAQLMGPDSELRILLVCWQLRSALEALPSGVVAMAAATVIRDASDTVTPQGVLALIPRPAMTVPESARPSLVLVLDGVADPGNTGTLVRTAAACGIDVVAVAGGCDAWGPKALRSGMGATFKLPIVDMADWQGKWSQSKQSHGLRLVTHLVTPRDSALPLGRPHGHGMNPISQSSGHSSSRLGDTSKSVWLMGLPLLPPSPTMRLTGLNPLCSWWGARLRGFVPNGGPY